jgi:hypothetical protein
MASNGNITISGGLNSNIYSCSTISGSNLVVGSGANNTSIGYSWTDPNIKMKEFVEFGLQLMGIDLTFEEFEKMTELEKKTFIRDYKLEKLLKNNEE